MSTAQALGLSREGEQPPCFTFWAGSQTLLFHVLSPLLSETRQPSQHRGEHRASYLVPLHLLLGPLQATLTAPSPAEPSLADPQSCRTMEEAGQQMKNHMSLLYSFSSLT